MEQNNEPNLGRSFVDKVLPKLSPDEQVEFFNFTQQVDNDAKEKMRTLSPSLTAQRKQAQVNNLYMNGSAGVAGGQPNV